jgi:hypothetical protein
MVNDEPQPAIHRPIRGERTLHSEPAPVVDLSVGQQWACRVGRDRVCSGGSISTSTHSRSGSIARTRTRKLQHELPKRNRLGCGGSARRETQGSTDAESLPQGRPEFQGKSLNARNAGQRSPVWDDPKGADAARLLEALWGKP